MQYQWYSCIFGQYSVTIVNEYLRSYTRSPRHFLAIFSDTQLKKIILFKSYSVWHNILIQTQIIVL